MPEQTVCDTGSEIITGRSYTCSADVVLLQVVVVFVNVKVALPCEMPVTMPLLSTVATEGLLEVQVPPDAGVNWTVCPTHTEAGAEITGKALTVMGNVTCELQPFPSVTE